MTTSEPTTPAPIPDQAPAQAPDQSITAVLSRLGPAAILGVAWSVMPLIFAFVLLANMGSISDFLLQTNNESGGSLALALAMYIGIFIVSAGFGIFPTMSQAILGGFVFGISVGYPAALAGFTGASVLGYIIAKVVARKSVENELHKHPKAEIVRDAFIRHGYWKALGILILLRLSPSSPFAIMNGLMAVSGVRFVTYLIATVVGMAPRTFAYIWIGNQITNWDEYGKPKWLIVTSIVMTIAILMLLANMANKAIEKAMGSNPDQTPAPESDPNPPE